MRVFLLLIAVIPAVTLAEPTDCEQLIDAAKHDAGTIIYAGDKKDWETAFRYSDLVFQEIALARSYCEKEPAQLETANKLMHDYNIIDQALVCSFHSNQAQDHLDKALNSKDDWKNSLFHAKWASYYINEAVERCENIHKPDYIEKLKKVRDYIDNVVIFVTSVVKANDG